MNAPAHGNAVNICVDAREFIGTRRTGIGRYLENLLAPVIDMGLHRVFLACHDPALIPEALRSRAAGCVRLRHGPTWIVDQVHLPRAAAGAGCELLFSPYYKIPLLGGFGRIITVHDVMFLNLPGIPSWKKQAARLQVSVAAFRTDLILVDSQHTRSELNAMLPTAEHKTRVLYPALEQKWHEAVPEQRKHEVHAGMADNAPFMLYVGNFKPHKNVDLLIRAFRLLNEQGHANGRILLLVGGDPDNERRIRQLAAAELRSGCIRLHADVTDETLRALYASAEWTVTASSYEGFGYPLLEAMAGGSPVMCYPCTSIPEVTGDAALNFETLAVDSVCKTMAEAVAMPPEKRASLVERGRKNARSFLPENAARDFIGLLSALSAQQAS